MKGRMLLIAGMLLLGKVQAQSLCFQHAGPEDKPMPAFCVRIAPDAGKASAPDGALMLDASEWHAVQLLLEHSQGEALRADQFGAYRAALAPDGRRYGVPPQGMRRIVAALLHSSRLTAAQSNMLQGLALRLR